MSLSGYLQEASKSLQGSGAMEKPTSSMGDDSLHLWGSLSKLKVAWPEEAPCPLQLLTGVYNLENIVGVSFQRIRSFVCFMRLVSLPSLWKRECLS